MMTFYNDMSISDFLDYASASSDEMASLGNGRMIDYETGKYFEVKDEETAVFVASARNMLEELCKRNSNQKAIIEMLNAKIQETAPLHAEIERLKAALAEARDFIQDIADLEAVPFESSRHGDWEAKAFMYDQWQEKAQGLVEEWQDSTESASNE